RRDHRGEALPADPRPVPFGRELVELLRHAAPKQPPEKRRAHRDIGHEACEPLTERHVTAIRSSSPGSTRVRRAAFPREIARVMRPLESSYRISSPGDASANVLATIA